MTALNSDSPDLRKGICILNPESGQSASGVVTFEQDSSTSRTKIRGQFKGLAPNSMHGFHVHEFGNLLEGCKTAGAHYNPFGKTHGGPNDSIRHVGDLGNIQSNDNGEATVELDDFLITLSGDRSIIGRSLVVHRDQDDLGKGTSPDSLTTGNSGPRISCGVIGRAN